MIPRLLMLALCAVWPAALHAGQIVRVTDPRYFQRPQPVIFPGAEVKLVMFEFEAVSGDKRGKERAKQLHDAFLHRIQNLSGGAVITYVTATGQSIANYRIEAEEVAKHQGAKMALWGRVFLDSQGRSLLAARLALIEPPPGIEASYSVIAHAGGRGPPTEVRGVINAPISQARIDFAPIEGDATVLATILSGLARYYKGATRQGPEAARWLTESVDAFNEYIARVPESADAATLAQANLYLARALVRLADARPQEAASALEAAEEHAATAARLNPYDASVPPVLAVVAQKRKATPETVRARLVNAVRLAPTDATARLNLAVLDVSMGRSDAALQTIEQAKSAQRIQRKQEPVEQQQLERDIRAAK
jgi:hypothetical protein